MDWYVVFSGVPFERGRLEGAGSGPEQAKLKALLETVALERQKEASASLDWEKSTKCSEHKEAKRLQPIGSTRWAPSSSKWSYNPYKWPYKWLTVLITPSYGSYKPSYLPTNCLSFMVNVCKCTIYDGSYGSWLPCSKRFGNPLGRGRSSLMNFLFTEVCGQLRC